MAKIVGSFCFVWVLSMATLFSQDVFAGERLSITSKIANVRSGPGGDKDTLWQVETFYPIVVIEKKGNWYRFKDFEGDEGWMHESLVGKIKSVITIKDNCNVRSGPGSDTPVVLTVEKGVPFKVLQKKGEWFEVEHGDGDKGWLHKSLVW